MKKLKLLCRSARNTVEIYQCSCCGEIQLNIGPVSLVLKKAFFFQLSFWVQKVLEEFDTLPGTDSQKKICFTLGPGALLSLGFNELCDLGLCLLAVEKTLKADEKQIELSQYIQGFSHN